MENAGIPNGAAAPSAMENAGLPNGPAAPSAMENAGIPNGPAAPTQTATPVVREQDRLMPIANVIRTMRRVLPPHAKISDDAKEVIQECVSEFISFVTGEANEKCHAEHRKTVNAEDIIWALDHLGFDDYVLPMDAFLQRRRECQAGGGGAAAGDSRAVRRAPPRAPHAVPVQVQMQRAMYAPPAPVQGYTVAMAAMPTNFAPPHVDQGHAFGGQRAVAQQYYGYGYGEGAYGEGSSNHAGQGVCGDEESSSNGEPVPAVGTGQPVAEESEGNPVQSG